MHLPVMPEEALELLAVRADGVYIDATAGLGGHTGLIAQQLTTGVVIANDRDPKSLEMARRNTEQWSDRIRYCQGPFARLRESAAAAGIEKVDDLLSFPTRRSSRT